MNKIKIDTDKKITDISKSLYGIFFEDINRSGDGGLYAEMLANRAFDDGVIPDRCTYAPESKTITSPTGWVCSFNCFEGEGIYGWSADSAEMSLTDKCTLNSARKRALNVRFNGGKIYNRGFEGLAVREGCEYRFYMFAKTETAAEVEALFTIINELRDKGVSMVYISHKMDEILRISDEVTIMRDGQYIGTWESKDLTTDFIITKMVGRELSNLFPKRENVPGKVVFEVKDFTSINPKSFRHVNFNVKKGEILGVAGLVGAQRTELMEGLFGLRSHSSGTITFKGKELTINQPADAIKHGIALLTEDRRATGILGVLSIADNVSIASLNQYLIGGIMLDDNKIEQLVQDNVAKLSIKTPSSKTQIQSLSGGNQQKVLISRWLANDPEVFIMDEPTRGIDVGAKYEIYCIIAEMAKQGKSIIMISSEMSELIGMSDRIMVMCDGRCTGFIDGKDANQENIMALATQFE